MFFSYFYGKICCEGVLWNHIRSNCHIRKNKQLIYVYTLPTSDRTGVDVEKR